MTRGVPIRRLLCMTLSLLLLSALLAQPGSAAAVQSRVAELDALFTTADLMDATVTELLEAMQAGRLTSVRLVDMYLERIEAYDEALGLHSIISINPNARSEAAQADAALASGETLGCLHGIPVIVKDNIDVCGMATTCGDIDRASSIALSDAEVVTRLKAEGAIILAKANMSLYAQSGNCSRSTIAGSVHNAYDLTRTPAGSSGGTAVAITCNFAAIGLGTDTASSIRRPSSFANLYGLRPSHGLVSQDGLYRLAASKDVIGPMCRSAEDLALLLDVIAGSDSKDSYTSEADQYLPEGGYTACLNENGLAGKRIGYLANSFGYFYSISSGSTLSFPTKPDETIVPMITAALDTIVSAGAELVDLSGILTETDISLMHLDTTDAGRQRSREVLNALFAQQKIDAIVYVSQTDVPEDELSVSETPNNEACYINIFGPLAGLPDLCVPMGLSETDADTPNPLPLGLSFFSAYGNEATLIEIAYAYEQQTSVRVQPSTTPALPDAALADFAAVLCQDCAVLLSSRQGDAALSGALAALEPLTMEQTDDDSRQVVDVATYQDAVRALAVAYDEAMLQIATRQRILDERAIPRQAQLESTYSCALAEAVTQESGVELIAVCTLFAASMLCVFIGLRKRSASCIKATPGHRR